MPLPLNQKTKRFSMAADVPSAAASAAYAVPVELNMLTNGGSPTCTAPPASVRPFRKRLRDKRERLVITCDTGNSSLRGELPRHHHGNHHIFKLEARLTEILGNFLDRRLVGGGIAAARYVP